MKISMATMDQLDEIMDVLSAVVKDMLAHDWDQWGEDHPSREMFIEHITDSDLRVVIDNDKIIAFILLTAKQDKEYDDVNWEDKDGRALIVHRVAVHPARQREGIANFMMDFAEQYAVENGFTSIRLDTYSKNPRTPKFFEQRGYKYRGQVHFPQRNLPYNCYEKILV
ncbi:MAG: GNAT family N-acetyltransferase [Thermoplasmata archaeon]|nr:MAG: GNAT family N-acetyltransferase [Thermoplasmata archaeon]